MHFHEPFGLHVFLHPDPDAEVLFSWICSVRSFFLDYAQLGAFLDSACWLFVRALLVGRFSGLCAVCSFSRLCPLGSFSGRCTRGVYRDARHLQYELYLQIDSGCSITCVRRVDVTLNISNKKETLS